MRIERTFLIQCLPHFPPNFLDIACKVPELNATPCLPRRGNENNFKYGKYPPNGNRTHNNQALFHCATKVSIYYMCLRANPIVDQDVRRTIKKWVKATLQYFLA